MPKKKSEDQDSNLELSLSTRSYAVRGNDSVAGEDQTVSLTPPSIDQDQDSNLGLSLSTRSYSVRGNDSVVGEDRNVSTNTTLMSYADSW